MTAHGGRRLSRAADGRPAAPVRHVHLGAGAFFRAHQAWYTEHARDAGSWGIAAFTGRSPDVAQALGGQDGLYTLAVRGADGDRDEVVSSLSEVHAGGDLDAWRAVFALPDLAVVTTTVTEAGYRPVGDPDVLADVEALRSKGTDAEVTTVPGRLVLGLLVRHAAGLPPLTVVPCDNLPDNGPRVRTLLTDVAGQVDDGLATWVGGQVGFASTMVDRITPRTTDGDRAGLLAGSGVDDPALVVTEPFSEWVVQDAFVAGRPGWESAGATLVHDVRPFEHRKLLLLNGSHSLMAYAASSRGLPTVDAAIADPVVLGWVRDWWADARPLLTLPGADLDAYQQHLLERYRNPRIRHVLAQIAADGSQKLPIRIMPVVRHHLLLGRVSEPGALALAAWTLHLRGRGAPVTDPGAAELVERVRGLDLDDAVDAVLAHLTRDLGELPPQALRDLRDRVVTVAGDPALG